MDAIRKLGDDPRPHGSKKLAGEKDAYRIRVGDWRVIYLIVEEKKTKTYRVLVSRVKQRNERTYR